MHLTRDVTLGNALTIIAMVGALLAFALRIESRMTRMEIQIERLILNGRQQHGGMLRTSHMASVFLDPFSLAPPSPLPVCAHGVHTASRPLPVAL